MLGSNAATWRNRGGRAPMLFDTTAVTRFVCPPPARKEIQITADTLLVSRRGSLQGSDRSSSCSEFACSTEMMSDVPNIGTAAVPFKEKDDTPASSLAVVPYDGKAKRVAWATPLSLHDTRVITPMTHPNRSGQFSCTPTDYSNLDITTCVFQGTVNCEAEVALMDGTDFVCWLPCTVTSVRGNQLYDVDIHDVEEARQNSVAGQVAKGIHSSFLQYPGYDDIHEVSSTEGFELDHGDGYASDDSASLTPYNNGYDGDEDSAEDFSDDDDDDDEDSS